MRSPAGGKGNFWWICICRCQPLLNNSPLDVPTASGFALKRFQLFPPLSSACLKEALGPSWSLPRAPKFCFVLRVTCHRNGARCQLRARSFLKEKNVGQLSSCCFRAWNLIWGVWKESVFFRKIFRIVCVIVGDASWSWEGRYQILLKTRKTKYFRRFSVLLCAVDNHVRGPAFFLSEWRVQLDFWAKTNKQVSNNNNTRLTQTKGIRH